VSDIIQLLPDNIANQIAAGEVIQRPASAVKELLENAIDAGATQIHLIIKDAGKELIRVIDNGKGMSVTDARLCFERHATSKIKKIEDLFTIRTMGFRGEALASIAAVAQVELRTKLTHEDAGTLIHIENSTVILQEPCAVPNGTSISIKNLFFNVPARRNFLKTNTTEIRHIIDEFTRVAMAFCNVSFKLTNNDTDLFVLESGNLKQRILGLLGNNLANKLVPVGEDTDYLNVKGFVGTPDSATKTRGNQYFFVNNRFIRSAYLNHAVTQAFNQIIPRDAFATYVLFIDINPNKIDANVHPTKQEIKFEDEKIVYSFLNSAIKHSLNKNSIAPSIDFDLNADIMSLPSITQPFTARTQDQVIKNNLYQGFTQAGQSHFIDKNKPTPNWERVLDIATDIHQSRLGIDASIEPTTTNNIPKETFAQISIAAKQIIPGYISYPKQNGFLLIHIKNAVERITYDKLIHKNSSDTVQKLLHPISFEIAKQDEIVLQNLLETFMNIGFEIEPFGNSTFIIQGIPADIKTDVAVSLIEELIEQYKYFNADVKLTPREKLVQTRAWQTAKENAKQFDESQVQQLCEQLFASSHPTHTPRGAKTFIEINLQDFEKDFLAK
jgi:DNA mismatch repair protein MutL